EAFAEFSRQAHKEQYIIPYLISAFPGCTDEHMQLLKSWLLKRHWSPKQVQCFIPTPGTVATAMFYCGRDEEGNTLHVAKTDAERLRQHHILLD
ncbi:MAG: YgiQ family radical SAM protein, partial [Deltaproteobacteria bacterium]|nr:YgiQ family radical SAM protein [Deltaproteobacteria bacterium]